MVPSARMTLAGTFPCKCHMLLGREPSRSRSRRQICIGWTPRVAPASSNRSSNKIRPFSYAAQPKFTICRAQVPGHHPFQAHLRFQRFGGIVSLALAVFPEEGSPPPSSTPDILIYSLNRPASPPDASPKLRGSQPRIPPVRGSFLRSFFALRMSSDCVRCQAHSCLNDRYCSFFSRAG